MPAYSFWLLPAEIKYGGYSLLSWNNDSLVFFGGYGIIIA